MSLPVRQLKQADDPAPLQVEQGESQATQTGLELTAPP